MAKDIQQHSAQERTALGHLICVSDTALFERLLAPLEATAEKALTEHRQTMSFLQEYQKEPKPSSQTQP